MKKQVKLINSNKVWSANRRYKVNDVVSFSGVDYQNTTGANSIPSDLTDWILIDGQLNTFVLKGVNAPDAELVVVNLAYLTANYPNATTGFKVYQHRPGFATSIFEKSPTIWLFYQAQEVV